MPKLFCVSDIHGFYDELIKALDKAGFDENNKEYWLVVCGDIWDRGAQPIEVMNYLDNLPRKILVRGNHESLFEECVERGYPYDHDYSNGTFETICVLGEADRGVTLAQGMMKAQERAKPFFKQMVNYFETKNYIFVHSWIPVNNEDGLPYYYTRNRKFSFNPDWRNAHASDWEASRWGNPFEMAAKGFLSDKTVVFGHWHTSWPRHKYEGKSEWGKDADFSPYFGNGYIGIDACCAYSGKINVLVIEDEFLDE